MTSVEKSPNMMSTTGRIPVIAAPTAIPVNPASDIGVSNTRSVPNSSTSPVRTLNTVPASAMSSPQMKTRESRRISSAIASRTASPNVSSRVSGINVLVHLVWSWIRSGDRELHRFLYFGLYFRLVLVELAAIRELLSEHPVAEELDGIPLGFPRLFLLLRSVILAIHVADVVAEESVRIAHQKRRSRAPARLIDDALCCVVDGADILAVDRFCGNAERCSAGHHVACSSFRVMRVFVVQIVFADVDDRQLPK